MMRRETFIDRDTNTGPGAAGLLLMDSEHALTVPKSEKFPFDVSALGVRGSSADIDIYLHKPLSGPAVYKLLAGSRTITHSGSFNAWRDDPGYAGMKNLRFAMSRLEWVRRRVYDEDKILIDETYNELDDGHWRPIPDPIVTLAEPLHWSYIEPTDNGIEDASLADIPDTAPAATWFAGMGADSRDYHTTNFSAAIVYKFDAVAVWDFKWPT